MLQNNAQEQYKNLPDHVLFDHNDFRHELIAQEPMKSQQYATAKSKPIMATRHLNSGNKGKSIKRRITLDRLR